MKVNRVQDRVTVLFIILPGLWDFDLQDYERTKKRSLSSRVTGSALPPGWVVHPAPRRELLSEDLLSPFRCCRPWSLWNPGPWSLAPALAMDEITFRSDTVLSDVHLYTPNQRRLMVRLNGMGQPGKEPTVFSASSQKGRGGLACLTRPRTTSSDSFAGSMDFRSLEALDQ